MTDEEMSAEEEQAAEEAHWRRLWEAERSQPKGGIEDTDEEYDAFKDDRTERLLDAADDLRKARKENP